MATVSSTGISSGIDWNSFINAILQQEGQPIQRLQDKQTANNKRVSALQAIKSSMTALSSSLATLGSTSFGARTVSSTDTNNTYVTATASGAATGSYDLQVSRVATRGRISPTLVGGAPSNLAVADPLATPVYSGGSATFAVQGTDGVIKTLTLGSSNNNLYGLRDAINALGAADPNDPTSKGLGVTATVVNTGSGANPYQLVLTAKDTGTGVASTGGKVTIADVTAGGAVNTLGISAGTVDSLTAPTTLSGGLSSTGTDVAQDALFTVNGIQLTRQSNTVTDAVDGVTFTLKQGGQATPTTFTIGLDKGTITSAMQDVISKFNAMVTTYKNASASGGPLANDSSARSLISQVRSALSGSPAGMPASATFTSAASLGVKTNRDGTLSLDTTAFQAALDKDPAAAKRVFAFTGDSSNGAVSFYAGGPNTTTGAVGFNITSYASGGAVSGTFTVGGSTYTLTGSNGTLTGASGTPLEGLILSVSGLGSGTLNLTRGVGQAVQDAISQITDATSGNLSLVLKSIGDQNATLSRQIAVGQQRLDRRKEVLQAQYAQLEGTIGQLQAAGQSLSGLR